MGISKSVGHGDLSLVADYVDLGGSKNATLTLSYIVDLRPPGRRNESTVSQAHDSDGCPPQWCWQSCSSPARGSSCSACSSTPRRRGKASRAEATRAALSIESQLQVLTGVASHQAARAAAAISGDDAGKSLAAVAPIHNTFWIATDGMAGDVRRTPRVTIAKGIVSEWASTAPLRNASAPSVLGPMREGSQWLVAARAPIRPATRTLERRRVAWAIAYADLDQLLVVHSPGRNRGRGLRLCPHAG